MVIQFKAGRFTKQSATGSQAITGVGFTPKIVLFMSSLVTSVDTFQGDSSFQFGASNVTNQRSIFMFQTDAVGTSAVRTGWHTNSVYSFGTETDNETQLVTVTGFDSDGFTLSWSVNTTPNYMISYIAIGGDDLSSVSVNHFNAPSSTGDNAVTGVGFEPDLVLLFSSNHTGDDQIRGQGSFSIGAFNSDLEMGTIAECIEDAQATMDTARYQRDDKCLALFSTTDTTTLTHEATVVSMDSDGFTLNYTTASLANKRVAYIALRGLRSKIGSFTAPTTGITPISQSTTGVGFQPRGIMLLSAGNTASASITTHIRYSVGAANDSASEFCDWCGDQDSAGSAVTAKMKDSDAVIRVSDEASAAGSTTTQALADFFQFESDGFELTWTTRTTSNAYQVLYMAFGDTSVVVGDTDVRKRISASLISNTGDMIFAGKKRYIHTFG